MRNKVVSILWFLLLTTAVGFAQLDILRPSAADPTVNNPGAAEDGNLATSASIQVVGQFPNQPPVYFTSTTGNVAGFPVRQHNYTAVVLKYKCTTVSQPGASFTPTETVLAFWAGNGSATLTCDGNVDVVTLPASIDTSSVSINMTAVVENAYMGAQGQGWVYLYEAWLEGTYPKSATTTTLTSTSNPAAISTSVTFTASINADVTGTVTFSDETTTLGTSSVTSGQATLTTSSLIIGTHSITAAYSGDANFNPSTASALTEAVYGTTMTAYYPDWGPSAHYYVKNVITTGSAPLLTIVNYAFANVTNNSCALYDPNADYEQKYTAANSVNGIADGTATPGLYGNFHQLQELKSQFPNLKVIVSLGGATLSAGFSSAAQPANVSGLVSSCIDMFINGNIAPGVSAPGLFDGIDINWEWPKAADTTNYVNMLALFRSQLNATRPGLLLTIAGTPGSWATGAQPLTAIYPYLDYINVETYGYAGPWEKTTNFVAPLYGPTGSPTASHNIDATIQSYLAAGVPASKLLMGFPLFAYDWTSVPNTNNGLFQTATPDPTAGTYQHIVQILPNFTEFRDPTSQSPSLFDGTTFWTFDDPTSIAFKMTYLRNHGLAGAMLWNLDEDTTGTLIQAIYSGLH